MNHMAVEPGTQFQMTPRPFIASQPGISGVCMLLPQPIDGVPSGLEYLTMIDKVCVHQLFEIRELVLNYESKNRYVLLNANGEQVYYAFEESTLCQRLCWGTYRPFVIHIVDNFQKEVLRVTRPFKCCGGGCFGALAGYDSCSYECIVESPPGIVIGTVNQRRACCTSSFYVRDADNQVVLVIDGPCCLVKCGCHSIDFPISTCTGDYVGDITKKWRGCISEAFTDADVFSVTFPMDLDVKSKALLLGATFLIDFMEFEQPPKNG